MRCEPGVDRIGTTKKILLGLVGCFDLLCMGDILDFWCMRCEPGVDRIRTKKILLGLVGCFDFLCMGEVTFWISGVCAANRGWIGFAPPKKIARAGGLL